MIAVGLVHGLQGRQGSELLAGVHSQGRQGDELLTNVLGDGLTGRQGCKLAAGVLFLSLKARQGAELLVGVLLLGFQGRQGGGQLDDVLVHGHHGRMGGKLVAGVPDRHQDLGLHEVKFEDWLHVAAEENIVRVDKGLQNSWLYWINKGIEKDSDKNRAIASFWPTPEEMLVGGLDLLVLMWVFCPNIPILTLYSCIDSPMIKQIEILVEELFIKEVSDKIVDDCSDLEDG